MSRIVKHLLIVAATIIGLFILGSFALKRFVERELSMLELGEMRVSSGAVRINLLRRTISLHDVHLITDTERRDADTVHRSPIRYIDATVGRLTLQGIRLKGIRAGIFELNSLSVESPEGTLVTRPAAPYTTKKASSFHLQSIDIKHIKFSDAALDWQRITANDTLIYEVSGFDLSSESFRWRSGQPLTPGWLQGSVRDARYTFSNRDYTLKISDLFLNFADSTLVADSVKLLPQHPRNRFMQLSAAHSDYTEAAMAGLICKRVDFQTLLNEKRIQIDSVGIAAGRFESYKNRQLNYGPKTKPMLHAMIQNIPIPFEIRNLSVENFDAAYEELAVHGNEPGRVTFDGIEATAIGLTNRPRRAGQTIEVQIVTKLMNRNALQAAVSLPADPSNDRFGVKATLRATPFASLNPMVEPLAQVELKGGQIDRLDFAMTGNSTMAHTDMTLRYSGLEIALVRERHGIYRERLLLSNLVNLAIVRHDNPDRRGLRTVSETVYRDSTRSAFNYLWKGVSAGVLETAETGAARRLLSRK